MSTLDGCAVFRGRVRHRRFGEPMHSFSYRVWHVLLDVDRLPEILAELPLVSHNQFNILGFYDRDHMRPEPGTVRNKLDRWLQDRGAAGVDGRVLLLTGLRHLGYGFNPVSFYFCHSADNELVHVVAEVNNTFGETYCYLLPGCGARRVVRHLSSKEFHVSPFHPVDGTYRFRITRPAEQLTIHMDLLREGERVFDATLSSRREPLTTRSLVAALAGHAHMAAATILRIHWQALRLWIKRAPVHRKPEMPANAWRTRHG